MQFFGMNIRKLMPAADGTLIYKIDMLNHDLTNLTGTVGVMPPREYIKNGFDFHAGMLMIDMTPEGMITADVSDESMKETRSLKVLADQHGLDYGQVPATLDAHSVKAQGVWTTAFLGPFNAWAWACCAFKIPEHLIIGWVAFPSYVVLILCCV